MSLAKPGAIEAMPPRFGWRGAVAHLRTDKSHSVILGGSMVMLIGSAVVSAFNFGYNVSAARMLGPEGFGHASAAVTLLMLASAITLSFQLVCAKFVARNESAGARQNIYSALHRKAWFVSLLLAVSIAAASGPIARYLNLPSRWIVVLLAAGIAFYVPLGARRGRMQGTCSFGQLSGNFVLEAVTRFGGALALMWIGYGVMGAVGAITASVAIAYLVPSRRTRPEPQPACSTFVPASFREGMQAIVFFVGQVIINNIDILLVKHYFKPELAGLYAAVALVGRVVYFSSWQVASAMFPIAAGSKSEKESASVLVVPLLLVVAIAVGAVVLLGTFSHAIVTFVFGGRYTEAEPLLSLYAASTGCYALSVVLMTFEMSRKIANTAWLQMAFSGALVVGISAFHATLQQVIVVQVVLMVLLLTAVSFPFFRMTYKASTALREAA
jgi:O-antigen/teichoic acid export membrane protein